MLLVPDETRKRLAAERDAEASRLARARAVLKAASFRPTRQRVSLACLLFGSAHQHVTADDLHQAAILSGVRLSLATVYNTLNQFAEAGLLRKVSVDGGRTWFDTDTESHQHFYIEAEDRIIDISAGEIRFGSLPEPPSGYDISKVDIVIRLERVTPEADCHGSAKAHCTDCLNCRSLEGLKP